MAVTFQVMGIVNVTPDSFYPATRTAATADAIARGRALFAAGADVVDVGGESTRPGSLPVVDALANWGPVSIDTQKEAVARAAVAGGARIVNDVSGTLGPVAGELGVGYVAMHRQGDSATMQDHPTYADVVGEVLATLRAAALSARAVGVGDLWLDPGIGFGKTVEHNLALLAHVDQIVELARQHDAGVLIGTSRKRFLGTLSAAPLDVDERLEGSIATEAWAALYGATMIRAHDVEAAVQLRELVVRPVEEVTA